MIPSIILRALQLNQESPPKREVCCEHNLQLLQTLDFLQEGKEHYLLTDLSPLPSPLCRLSLTLSPFIMLSCCSTWAYELTEHILKFFSLLSSSFIKGSKHNRHDLLSGLFSSLTLIPSYATSLSALNQESSLQVRSGHWTLEVKDGIWGLLSVLP